MADRLTVEHYVGECFVKCAQVILASRVSTGTRSVPDKRANRWFHLEIEEVDAAAKELEAWRKDVSAPLFIEIFIQPWGAQGVVIHDEHARSGQSPTGEILLERWSLQYQRTSAQHAAGVSRSASDEAAVYKRMIIMIRSLYSYTRILPAYRLYRACKRYQGTAACAVGYKVLRTAARNVKCSASKTQQFCFAPVDTPTGNFRIAVDYAPASAIQIIEHAAVPATVPRIISDYIGVPGASGQQSLRQACSASMYETRSDGVLLPDPSSSPPIHAGAGILRGPLHKYPSAVYRQSWSSKDTKTQGSGNRKSSSGGSTVSTPPSPHPHTSVPRPPPPTRVMAEAKPLHSIPWPASTSTSQPKGVPGHPEELTERNSMEDAAACIVQGEGCTEGTTVVTLATATRQQSAPMSIPGNAQQQRTRSAHDLARLNSNAAAAVVVVAPAVRPHPQAELLARQRPLAPSSAPAAPRGMLGQMLHTRGTLCTDASQAVPGLQGPALMDAAAVGGGPPLYPCSSSGSSVSSAFPMSCSPQLPFAFTPSGQSVASMMDHQGFLAGPPPVPPSPSVSGRDISALATIRRPSWTLSSKSSSFDVGAMLTAQQLSMSPLQDMLDSSLMSSSTPRQLFLYSPLSSPMTRQQPSGSTPPGPSPGVTQALPVVMDLELWQGGGGGDDAELDCLPFALDAEGPVPTCVEGGGCGLKGGAAGPLAGVAGVHVGPSTPGYGQVLMGLERDAAVGAFIRMLQEAPPLAPPPGTAPLTAGAAMSQLSDLTERIRLLTELDCAK